MERYFLAAFIFAGAMFLIYWSAAKSSNSGSEAEIADEDDALFSRTLSWYTGPMSLHDDDGKITKQLDKSLAKGIKMLHVLAMHPTAIITLVVLICFILGLSKVLNEPAFTVRKTSSEDEGQVRTSPWAGGPTGVSIGSEDVGNV